MTPPRATESGRDANLQGLLDQFAYMADEMDAQTTLLPRISDSVLSARPFEGAQSIRDRYAALLDRERAISERLDGLRPDFRAKAASGASYERPESVVATVRQIGALRRRNAEVLRALEAEVWSVEPAGDDRQETLPEWIYGVVLGDAGHLKEIGELFYEQPLSFSGDD